MKLGSLAALAGGIALCLLLVWFLGSAPNVNDANGDPDRNGTSTKEHPGKQVPSKGPERSKATGSLELTFLDRATPVPGIEVLLCPPGSVGETGARWMRWAKKPEAHKFRRTSDRQGTVRFEDLPPSASYRWALSGTTGFHVTPKHEWFDAKLDRDGGFNPRVPPLGVSGQFEIRAGETTRLTIRDVPTGVLRGVVIPRTAFLNGALVKVYTPEKYERGSQAAVLQWSSVYESRTDKDGEFVVRNVQPGPVRVVVRWREAASDWYLAGRIEDMPEDGDLDLGRIEARQTPSLPFRVRATADGREFTDLPKQATVMLVLDTKIKRRRLDEWFSERFALGQMRDGRIFGLSPSTIWIRAATNLSGWEKPPEIVQVRRSLERSTVQHPTDSVIDVPIRISRQTRLQVKLHAQVSLVDARLRCFVAAQGADDPMFDTNLGQTKGDGQTMTIEARAPIGAGAFVVAVQPKTGPSLFGQARFGSSDARSHDLDVNLEAGTPLSGIAIGPDGKPLRKIHLFFGLMTVPGCPIWAIETDDEGQFTIPGGPLSGEIECIGPAKSRVERIDQSGKRLRLTVVE